MEKEDQKCFVCGHEKSKHPRGNLDDDECPGIYSFRELRQHIFILVLRAGIFGFVGISICPQMRTEMRYGLEWLSQSFDP